MSRATIVLLIVVVALVAGLVVLSKKRVAVTPHRIEKAVTLGGGGDAAAK